MPEDGFAPPNTAYRTIAVELLLGHLSLSCSGGMTSTSTQAYRIVKRNPIFAFR